MPQRNSHRPPEILRGGLGAGVGIVVASLVARAIPGGPEMLPFIVAPIGASAVLVFAAPASPLAQPWPALAGNMVSAAVGIEAARLFDDRMTAAAVAVGVAIVVMMMLNCLHPPGGACALFAAVGAPAIREHGFAFALWPVGANTAALLVVAVIVNNLTGRQYPHVPGAPPAVTRPGVFHRSPLAVADIEAAMNMRDVGLDPMPADVLSLVRDAQRLADERHRSKP